MPLLQIIVLALTQGVTEFLPISSSAHLILVSRWFEWPDQGLGFDMALHAGSLIAVVAYLRRDLGRLAGAVVNARTSEDHESRRLALQIVLTTVPVGLCGWWFQDWIAHEGRNILLIAMGSIVFGALLWLSDLVGSRTRALGDLTWPGVLALGAVQALALVPGTSRSGIVMTMALALGFVRTDSARLAFLMAVPVMTLVGVKNMLDLVLEGMGADWLALSLGFIVSAVTAYAAVSWMIDWLGRQGMAVFALYRIALGAILLAGLWL